MTLPSDRARARLGRIRWYRPTLTDAQRLHLDPSYHAAPVEDGMGRARRRSDARYLCKAERPDVALIVATAVNAADACPECMAVVARLARSDA